jgi:hypothetical protein
MMVRTHKAAHGNADLVAHFFRRAFDLLRDGGAYQAGDSTFVGFKHAELMFLKSTKSTSNWSKRDGVFRIRMLWILTL